TQARRRVGRQRNCYIEESPLDTGGTRCLLRRGWRVRRSGADHPAGSGKADFRSMYIGLKGGAGRFDDLVASLFFHLMQYPAEGTEPGQVMDQFLLGKGADNINRTDADLGPLALLKDAADPALVREGKLPRLTRPADGNVRQERRRSTLSRRHER